MGFGHESRAEGDQKVIFVLVRDAGRIAAKNLCVWCMCLFGEKCGGRGRDQTSRHMCLSVCMCRWGAHGGKATKWKGGGAAE